MIYFITGANHAMPLSCKADNIKQMESYLKKWGYDLDLEKDQEKLFGKGNGYGVHINKNKVQCDYWLKYDGRLLKGIQHVKTAPFLFS